MNKHECLKIALVKSASIKESGKKVYRMAKKHYQDSPGISKLNVGLLVGSLGSGAYGTYYENSKDKEQKERAHKAKLLAIGLGGAAFVGEALHKHYNPGVNSPVYETISKIRGGGD